MGHPSGRRPDTAIGRGYFPLRDCALLSVVSSGKLRAAEPFVPIESRVKRGENGVKFPRTPLREPGLGLLRMREPAKIGLLWPLGLANRGKVLDMRNWASGFIVTTAVLLGGCAGTTVTKATADASMQVTVPPQMELLNATLWVQRSAEYRAACWQAYALAKTQLDRALADPKWTAADEQKGSDVHALPPAVILDIDETVVDNSPFEARIIRDRGEFDKKSWAAWVDEASAKAVPGALDFLQHAASQGVAIYYISNRDDFYYDATLRNLRALGCPVGNPKETILLRHNNISDKTPRREIVAKTHRILLLIGDNNGDFAGTYTHATEDARATAANHDRPRFGKGWITIPNPMYGDWEGAAIDYNWKQPRTVRIAEKCEKLRYE